MIGIIGQLNAFSVSNTYKTHDLLDKAIAALAGVYQTENIRFNQQNIAFEYQINDEYTFVVGRDLNAFAVIARVVNTTKNNDIAAECVVDVNGGYNRRFGEIDAEVKQNVSAVFMAIGAIDTTTLQDSTEAEEAASEAPAEPEKVEAEVVSEG